MSYPDDIFAYAGQTLETPGNTITLEWPHAGLWLPVLMRLEGVGEGKGGTEIMHVDIIRHNIAWLLCYQYQEDNTKDPWSITWRLANNFMEWQGPYAFGVLPRCPIVKGDQLVATLEIPAGGQHLTALHVEAIRLGDLNRSLYKDAVGYTTA